jgi:hypothetical protein
MQFQSVSDAPKYLNSDAPFRSIFLCFCPAFWKRDWTKNNWGIITQIQEKGEDDAAGWFIYH